MPGGEMPNRQTAVLSSHEQRHSWGCLRWTEIHDPNSTRCSNIRMQTSLQSPTRALS
jgi:hypothetical protein